MKLGHYGVSAVETHFHRAQQDGKHATERGEIAAPRRAGDSLRELVSLSRKLATARDPPHVVGVKGAKRANQSFDDSRKKAGSADVHGVSGTPAVVAAVHETSASAEWRAQKTRRARLEKEWREGQGRAGRVLKSLQIGGGRVATLATLVHLHLLPGRLRRHARHSRSSRGCNACPCVRI